MVNWAVMLECYVSLIISTEQSSFRLSLLLWLSSFYALISQPTHSDIRSVGRSIVQLVNQVVKPSAKPVGLSFGWLIGQSVSHPVTRSVIRSIGQSASQCEKIVVLASKFRFLVLKTCRLKACACTCADSGSAAIEIDSARKLLWHVVVHTSNSFFNASLSYPRRSHSPRKPISNGNQGSW